MNIVLASDLCNLRVTQVVLVLQVLVWYCMTGLDFMKRAQEKLLMKIQLNCNNPNDFGNASHMISGRQKQQPQ